MGKFITKTGKDGQFYFNLNADNGQTILSSQGYTTKAACVNGIESVKTNSAKEDMFEKKDSANDKFYFNLKATNGQIIGSSQMYTTSASRDNGIASVQKNAPGAAIEDE